LDEPLVDPVEALIQVVEPLVRLIEGLVDLDEPLIDATSLSSRTLRASSDSTSLS
jgi:hypothetical protein